MDSANVQVLRRLEDLFNSRDFDAYVELFDPAIEWHVAREDPDATVHHGPAAVRVYLEGWVNAFDDLRISTHVIADHGAHVHTEIGFRGHGTESGVPLDDRVAFVFTLRDGLMVKVDDLGREGLQASTK